MGDKGFGLLKHVGRETAFRPRIINPVRVGWAVFLASDEEIRDSARVVSERMPWVRTQVLRDPVSMSNHKAGEAAVYIMDDTAMTLSSPDRIRANNADAVVALLTYNLAIQRSPASFAAERYPYTAGADLVFAVNRGELAPGGVITSVVRAAEDSLNIAKYAKEKAYIFLVVDDEPRWFSEFLPVLYGIIGQRADVKVTRTYEETLRFLFGVEHESQIDEANYRSMGHGDDVVCLIADIFFPRGGKVNPEAGRDLVNIARKYYPRYPIVVASKAKEAEDLRLSAFIMPKGSPESLDRLRGYILDHTGMGDFLLCDETGQEVYRIRSIHQMYGLLLLAEQQTDEARRLRDMLEVYGQHDRFSAWFYMHSHRDLGDRLRPVRAQGRRMVAVLKKQIEMEIMRMERTPLVVDGVTVRTLHDLLRVLNDLPPDRIQYYSDNDILSSWLDRKGYAELADDLRPIHGSGHELVGALSEVVEKWIAVYSQRPEA